MTTRIKRIPLEELDLADNESVIDSSVEANQVVLTISVEEDQDKRRQAGREFLKFVEQMNRESPVDWEALDENPDPRLRAILDGCQADE